MVQRFRLTKRLIPFLLSLFMLTPSIADAQSFVGGKTTVDSPQGVRAVIYTPNTYPSVGSNDFSSAWVAMTESDGDIIQVGYAHEPKFTNVNNPHYFWGEITRGGQYFEIRTVVGPARGSSHFYKIEKSSTGMWEGYADDAKIGDESSLNISPFTVEYFNEVSDTFFAQFIGSETDPLKFSSVHYKDTSNRWTRPMITTWDNASGEAGLDNYNYQWTFSDYWTSWDK